MRYVVLICLLSGPVGAGPMDVHAAATRLFDRLPNVVPRAGDGGNDIRGLCGAGLNTHPAIGYCTTNNTIYVAPEFEDRPLASYEMAHVLGHAIQVRHGVADVALREISRRRDEEDALRGMVTRQVDCIAGVLMAEAGEPPANLRALDTELFTDAHWGRNPLNSGPRVSIGIEARAQWYDIGYSAQGFGACSVGEMSADLILNAVRSD